MQNADPAQLQALMGAQNQLGSALSRLLVTVERYPDLKANAQIADLMVALEGRENRIGVSRKRYNEAVEAYNTRVVSLIGGIIARSMGTDPRAMVEADAAARTVPKVEL